MFKKILSYCESHGLSIAAFERMCDIGNGTLSRYERGKVNPTLKTIKKICIATSTHISDWVGDEDA